MLTLTNNLLISIRPKFADRILSGEKTIELRRQCPKVSLGDNLLFYFSSPNKYLGAISKIEKITSARLDNLWLEIKENASVTYEEFNDYFQGADYGYAIYFSEIQKLHNPICLSRLKEIIPGFNPPQSFRYFSHNELTIILATGGLLN